GANSDHVDHVQVQLAINVGEVGDRGIGGQWPGTKVPGFFLRALNNAQRSSRTISQRLPAFAAGECGCRMTRQPACASGAIIEESWVGNGVATGPSGPSLRSARR